MVAVLVLRPAALAFETDQYNLPPTPLADIGEEVEEYVEDNLRTAIDKLNAEIETLTNCAEGKNEKCESPAKIQRLVYLRSEEAIARAVFERLGDGVVPFTKSGTWMNSHKFRAQPARYKTAYRRSIFVYLPSDYFTISPTVNMYGHNFGTDKIAHFFQQGYSYYRKYKRAVAAGLSDADAEKKAVNWGRTTENTYFGTLVGGVFSNGDLYANFAGMRFYQGLAKPVTIGGSTRPAVAILKNGLWIVNESPDGRREFLKPFISDHLNEALNPSVYVPGLRSSIRRIVKKQSCPAWRTAFPNMTKQQFEVLTKSLKTWGGFDYGHKDSGKFVTISNSCFDGP